MITVVDCGMGNIRAFLNIYKRLNIPAQTASKPEEIMAAEKLILPGVGAFDWAMTRLERCGLRGALERSVLERKTPVLGICIGMHMMAHASEEGKMAGLGWIGGEVKRLELHAGQKEGAKVPLPHMGWNVVNPRHSNGLFDGFGEDLRFYFLHSYYFAPESSGDCLATTSYCGNFASGVSSGHIFGVQFHPEKSHGSGIRLLKNFAEL